eukprot:3882469-Rhodomonas_salina.1
MDTSVQRRFHRPEVGAHPITCPACPSGTATTTRAFLGDSLAGPAQQRRLRTTSGARSPFRSFFSPRPAASSDYSVVSFSVSDRESARGRRCQLHNHI